MERSEASVAKRSAAERMREQMQRATEWPLNMAGYAATPVACAWAGALMEEISEAFGQEQGAQKC